MKWKKKQFICDHSTLGLSWYKKNTMVPVPLLMGDRIRIFLTMCDSGNVGRIGCVDLAADTPATIVGHSKTPVLDIGAKGAFDDSGVLPSALFEDDGKHYMFYSAYQKQTDVPYTIFSGLSVFEDGSFSNLRRTQTAPILGSTASEPHIRSAPFCLKTKTGFRIYYSSGMKWIHNNVKEAPFYDIKCVETGRLAGNIDAPATACIALQNDEYGLTTPYVYQEGGTYKMTYSIRSISKGYRLGYAESPDGLAWTRKDEEMQIDVSPSGWDSEMICFGNMLRYKNKTYLFYCGNHYGMGGMGYAELEAR